MCVCVRVCACVCVCVCVCVRLKLQALVYDIHPSTTAVFSYAVGSRKLSANKQFFVGAHSGKFVTNNSNKKSVSFIVANKVYTSANKTTIVSIETKLFFLPGVDASHVYDACLDARLLLQSH